jgi:hypothetical protein
MNITMKKVIISIVTILLVIISCTKDDNGNIVLPTMSALIDGEEWVSITRITVLENGKFIITGTSTTGQTLVITIFGTTEGLYELNTTSIKVGAVYKESATASAADAYASVTGEVNLTDVDTSKKRISGTYQFLVIRNVLNSFNITNGEFNNLFYTITDGSD